MIKILREIMLLYLMEYVDIAGCAVLKPIIWDLKCYKITMMYLSGKKCVPSVPYAMRVLNGLTVRKRALFTN